MNYRERQEAKEGEFLSPRASLSRDAIRDKDEPRDEYRTEYQRDRDRIIHSKAFMRLADKTQVFFHSGNDHVRTRLLHTIYVAQIARTIANALNLNEDLAEAIALGHDLGHTPMGHAGEVIMDELLSNGFDHAINSVRIADLEGLNLTRQVKDGILNHGSERMAKSLEGQCVKFADKIGYVTHDFDDAIRLGKVPSDFHIRQFGLGETYSEMVDTMVRAVVEASEGKDEITMREDVWGKMRAARDYEFRVVIREGQEARDSVAREVIVGLFNYYKAQGKSEEWISDYISGMTDGFAIKEYNEIKLERR